MVKLIIETFPDMKEEVNALDDADIEEIYNQINVQNGHGSSKDELPK